MTGVKVFNFTHDFSTKTENEFVDLSEIAQMVVVKSKIRNGLLHAFAPHATGVLILTESDAALLEDIQSFVDVAVPRNKKYKHPSNAHSHLRSVMLGPAKTMPVMNGRVSFGTWQSLMFVETDIYPRQRSVIFQVIGET
jgi:secondary thiamine-phosphate synthase enzyme